MQKECIRSSKTAVSWPHCQKLNHIYGSIKNRRNYQVAWTNYSQRTADVPQSVQLLCQVCKTFCDNSCTTTHTVTERITMEMGNRGESCIQKVERCIHQCTGVANARLFKTVYHQNWCKLVCCWRRANGNRSRWHKTACLLHEQVINGSTEKLCNTRQRAICYWKALTLEGP